jgi:hypothetical protein
MIKYISLVLSTLTILSLFLFVFCVTLGNEHSTYVQQEKVLSSNNESNKVLGDISSNIWANPHMMIGGRMYGLPVFNAYESEPYTQAKEKGFLVAEEKDFKVSYPIELDKEQR